MIVYIISNPLEDHMILTVDPEVVDRVKAGGGDVVINEWNTDEQKWLALGLVPSNPKNDDDKPVSGGK